MQDFAKHEVLDRVSIFAETFNRYVAQALGTERLSEDVQQLVEDINQDLHELYQLIGQEVL